MGDLIHKGPDSAGCIAVADLMLLDGRWIQLADNYEAQYRRGPTLGHLRDRGTECVAMIEPVRGSGGGVTSRLVESPPLPHPLAGV